jgi:gliding motility-associated-like protein
MKKKIPFAMIVIAASIISNTLFAQNVLDNKVYRVTAYKNGNPGIMSVSNYVEVVPPLSVFIPDAFTPNGDGINDLFGVKGEGLTNFNLRIFNRWGEVLFESSNPKQQWDGTYKGKPVQGDTYVYQLYASGLGSKIRTGSVTLVR